MYAIPRYPHGAVRCCMRWVLRWYQTTRTKSSGVKLQGICRKVGKQTKNGGGYLVQQRRPNVKRAKGQPIFGEKNNKPGHNWASRRDCLMITLGYHAFGVREQIHKRLPYRNPGGFSVRRRPLPLFYLYYFSSLYSFQIQFISLGLREGKDSWLEVKC